MFGVNIFSYPSIQNSKYPYVAYQGSRAGPNKRADITYPISVTDKSMFRTETLRLSGPPGDYELSFIGMLPMPNGTGWTCMLSRSISTQLEATNFTSNIITFSIIVIVFFCVIVAFRLICGSKLTLTQKVKFEPTTVTEAVLYTEFVQPHNEPIQKFKLNSILEKLKFMLIPITTSHFAQFTDIQSFYALIFYQVFTVTGLLWFIFFGIPIIIVDSFTRDNGAYSELGGYTIGALLSTSSVRYLHWVGLIAIFVMNYINVIVLIIIRYKTHANHMKKLSPQVVQLSNLDTNVTEQALKKLLLEKYTEKVITDIHLVLNTGPIWNSLMTKRGHVKKFIRLVNIFECGMDSSKELRSKIRQEAEEVRKTDAEIRGEEKKLTSTGVAFISFSSTESATQFLQDYKTKTFKVDEKSSAATTHQDPQDYDFTTFATSRVVLIVRTLASLVLQVLIGALIAFIFIILTGYNLRMLLLLLLLLLPTTNSC